MPQKNDVENPVDPNNLAAVKAQEVLNRETGKDPYVNSGIDQLGAYGNDPVNTTGSNTDKAREQEEQPPSLYKPSGAQKKPRGANLWIRKRAAMIGITTILGGAGLASTFFAGPALLLVQFKEVLTNYGSASSRAADKRNNETIFYRLSNVGSTESACRGTGGVSSVRCKRGSMSEKNVQTLKDKGFSVESKVVGGRHIVSTITDPDGTQMKGTRASVNAAMAKPSFASRMKSASNPKTLVYNGGRFTNKVLKPLGLDKSAVKVEGDTDEERKESLNKLSGAADEDTREKTESKFRSQHEGKIKAVGKITAGPAATVGIGCSAYNMTRVTLTAVKLYNMARYASLAILFLKVADQIKANGSVDPATVAMLGGVLTSYATSGPTKGLTATDSQGYKTAAYGGEGKLSAFTQRFMLGGNQKLVDIDNSVKAFQEGFPGGKKSLRTTCGAASDPLTGVAVGAAFCTLSGAGGGAAGTAVAPVIGSVGGAIAGISLCVAGSVLGSIAGAKIIGEIFTWALPKIIDALTDAPIDVNKIKGPEAGDAAAVGADYLNGRANLSRGMQPGTKESVTSFNSGTQESANADLATEKYMAQSDPFDVYNEHSFFGSFVRNSGLINAKPLSPSFLGTLFSIATLSPIAGAAGSMPVNITTKDLDHCPDDSLKDIGVDCDAVGGTQFVMNAGVVVDSNLNFMVGVHVDEQGNPISEDYKNWTKNCTEQRSDPIGMTSVGIESEDDWSIGKACVFDGGTIDQNTRDNFSAYYFDGAAQEDAEYIAPVDSTTPANSDTTGGVVFATYNVRTSDLNNSWFGDNNTNFDEKDAARMQGAASVMMANKVNLFAVQEARGQQREALLDALPETYRATSLRQGQNDFSEVVYWDNSLYKEVSQGVFPMVKGGGKIRDSVWVQLESVATGGKLFVFGIHTALNERDRELGARQTLDAVSKVVPEGVPYIIAGDMNSNDRSPGRKGVYNVFTASGKLIYAREAVKNPEGNNCDTQSSPEDGKQDCRSTRGSHIDHVWVSKDPKIDVLTYKNIATAETLKYSDHNPVVTGLSIPGFGTQVDGEIAWPVDKSKFQANRSDFLNEHGGAGTFTSPNTDNISADISLAKGTPVYALAGGKVVKKPLGRSSRICAGVPNGDDNGGLMIESKVQGGTLLVAYAHGENVTSKGTVETGEKIMDVGQVGNSCGPHLHIDMSFNNKNVCPQDVFVALSQNKEPNFSALAEKGLPCGRV